MSTFYSPKIITDGLVVGLDAANIKSFRGEPTTNLVASAAAMSGWTLYYRTISATTFATEFGTIGYRFVNQPSWNGIYRNFNLVNSGIYTFSAWIRYWGGSANNNGAAVYVSNYGAGDVASEVNKTNVGQWQRVSHTVSVTSPSNVYYYLISYGGVDSGTGDPDFSSWEVTMPQIEFKSYPTQFVDGVRGATVATGGGWSDLSGNNNHGELVNGVTYSDGNQGSLVFDGVDDYIAVSNPQTLNPGSNSYSINCWIKQNDTGINSLVEARGNNLHGFVCSLNYPDVGYATMLVNTTNDADQNVYYSSVTSFGSVGIWMNVCIVVNRGIQTIDFYLNGIKQGSSISITSGGTMDPGGGYRYWIGGDLGGPESNASFAILQHYNRVLTATEVLQNFNAIRSRFGV